MRNKKEGNGLLFSYETIAKDWTSLSLARLQIRYCTDTGGQIRKKQMARKGVLE